MCEVKGMSAAGCRPRVLATDVILNVGASPKVVSRPPSWCW
jgi:hypothetical protein